MKKILSFVLTAALVIGLLPMTVFASESADLSQCEIQFDGEGWKVFPIENKTDELYADDLHISVVDQDGGEISSDAYRLVFGQFYWDDEKQEDVFIPLEEPFRLTINDDYMHSGFGGFGAYAVAEDDSGYTGQTEPREFMLWDKHSFNWFGANADFGEEYQRQCTWSWHDYYEIPLGRIEPPVIHGIAYEDVDPAYYEITYFKRVTGIPVSDDPDYDGKVYPEDKPLPKLPTEPGTYFAKIEGKEPYYGTSYVDFDIAAGYAQPLGSDTCYWDGYTLYLHPGETVKVHFELEPYADDFIVGWRAEELREAGFTVAEEPEFIDGVTYAVISADGLDSETSADLPYSFYRVWDVFDDHGGMHWDTAKPVGEAHLRVTLLPDDKPLLGDADGDGEVGIIDATLIQRVNAQISVKTDPDILNHGDVDGDGELDVVDATMIQRWLAFIATPYPIGDPIG